MITMMQDWYIQRKKIEVCPLRIATVTTIKLTAETVDVGALWRLARAVTALSTATKVWAVTRSAARTQ